MVVPVVESVSVSKGADVLTLKDITGAYSGSNTGGYGSPNAEEPTVVAMTLRYWPDTSHYGELITEDSAVIDDLLGSGRELTPQSFGVTSSQTKFLSGVHQLKYYPMELQSTVVTLTKNSKLVTVTAGTAPNTWNAGYIGIIFSLSGIVYKKVFLIDRTKSITSSTFYLTEAWPGDTEEGYNLYIAPEGDLKVFVYQAANACLVSRIGTKLGQSCNCDTQEVDKLMHMVMQMFASQVDFNCKDYQGAHNKVVAVDLLCNDCTKTCSCS